jgi:hypothetical protein
MVKVPAACRPTMLMRVPGTPQVMVPTMRPAMRDMALQLVVAAVAAATRTEES